MSDLVPTEDIERIVGIDRHPTLHYGRAVSSEEIVYILHSQECKDSGEDLRECEFSIALDNGIDEYLWVPDYENRAVVLSIADGYLVPHDTEPF